MTFQFRFGEQDFRLLERERVFDGYFAVDRLTLQHQTFAGGWNEPLTRVIPIASKLLPFLQTAFAAPASSCKLPATRAALLIQRRRPRMDLAGGTNSVPMVTSEKILSST